MDDQGVNPDISVVVPTLNEAQNVDALLTGLFRVFGSSGRAIEVLFADGGSTDGTQEKVRAWAGRAPVRLVNARSGRGLAGDVMVAARQAKAGVILVMDGDLSHNPEQAPMLTQPVLKDAQDMVIGSRYVPGGRIPNWPWRRRMMSRVAAAGVWPLVDVHDPHSGFFAVRRDRLLRVTDDAAGFKIGLETLLRNDGGLRVDEVPICFSDRSQGRSKMTVRQAVCCLGRVVALTGGTTAIGRLAPIALLGLAADIGGFDLLRNFDLSLPFSHILSFLLASILGWLAARRSTFPSSAGERHGWGPLARWVPVCLAALFFRGGVLALLTQRAGWSEHAALPMAAFAALLVTGIGAVFFVFRRDDDSYTSLSWRTAAVGLTGYAVLLRLVYLGLPDLLPEEAYYWNYAQHPALGYLDHPPMVAWLIGLGTTLFGDTEFGVRLGTFLCWFITAGFSFALARDLFGKGIALITVMLTAVLPFFFLFGFFATPDAPLTACWAGALLFLERALSGGRARAWWGAGICLGLGMLSKYTIALLVPATLAFLLLDRPSRRWLRRPEPYLAAMLAGLLFSPVILWNQQHGWASFLFQTAHRLDAPARFGLPMLLAAMVLLITPLGFLDAVRAVLPSRREREGAPSRARLFATVFTLVPLSVFVLFSLGHDVRMSWTGPLWLATLPAVAERLLTAPGPMAGGFEIAGRRLWPITLIVTVLLFGGFLHSITIGLPGLGIDEDMDLPMAWEEIGRDVEDVARYIHVYLGVQPLVVGMDKYALASELAFYRRCGREGVEQTSSRHHFGGSGLMYSFWFPPERYAGRTLLLVSLDRENLQGRQLPWWARLDPIAERTVSKYGQSIRYYFRVAHEYRPPPPAECDWTSQ
jgi:dolichol-phosphate mannosyltransferase